jgi:hypothetical protein
MPQRSETLTSNPRIYMKIDGLKSEGRFLEQFRIKSMSGSKIRDVDIVECTTLQWYLNNFQRNLKYLLEKSL